MLRIEAHGGFTVDGNYGLKAMKRLVWEDIEVVVWLDLDFWIVLGRAFWRTAYRAIYHVECCNGNYEQPGRLLTKDSVIYSVLRRHHLMEERVMRLRQEYPQQLLVQLRCPKDVDLLWHLVEQEVLRGALGRSP